MTPRALLLTAVLAVSAAVLGYFTGKSGSASLTLRNHQALANPSSPPGAGTGGRIAAFKISAMKVRSAPATRSEEAWVKWAFAVPDTDLADAVASLNPLTDFHALRVLFSRWARLDPQAAWKAFDAIPIPDQSTRWYEGSGETGLSMTGSTLQNAPPRPHPRPHAALLAQQRSRCRRGLRRKAEGRAETRHRFGLEYGQL